ncbi:NnrS family protein [Sneathiella sp.]|uniref:NnrS family protein n=1 Tax=Sneathiella sp. TaxID=1964365 RepID=UPI002FE3205C
MTMAIPRVREYTGPAFLSYGYRTFFFLGALFAGLSILVWVPLFFGHLSLHSDFAPADWHTHEIYFGYLAAIVTGFLFTAIPNWTGRPPVRGVPLLLLALLWFAGRLAIVFSASLGWVATMVVDLLFLAAILAIITNEIIAGKNWRNLMVVVPFSLLLLANICFHLEAHFEASSYYSRRLAMMAAIILIMLIGGRIIPAFTRNWLMRQAPGRLPVAFNRFDGMAIGISVLALIMWIIFDTGMIAATLFFPAAVLQFLRLARWQGVRTFSDPLVLVLHVGYLFIPVGFLLLALAGFFPYSFPALAGIHALGVGAIGVMTLSVMVRATLGHSGSPLIAGVRGSLVFLCVVLAGVTRIISEFIPEFYTILLYSSAVFWMLAFLGYAFSFSPQIFRARQ